MLDNYVNSDVTNNHSSSEACIEEYVYENGEGVKCLSTTVRAFA